MCGSFNFPYKEEVRGSNPLAPTGFFGYPKQNIEQNIEQLL